jgi:hypothetical protein
MYIFYPFAVVLIVGAILKPLALAVRLLNHHQSGLWQSSICRGYELNAGNGRRRGIQICNSDPVILQNYGVKVAAANVTVLTTVIL